MPDATPAIPSGTPPTPYYADDAVTLWHGDALAVLRELPSGSVDCCVTSPPYFGLRDYGTEGQYGLEASPAEYVETMRAVFAEVRRVLSNDGTLWLNIGDSYNSTPVGNFTGGGAAMAGRDLSGHVGSGTFNKQAASGLPPKNLLMIPARTALALQADGWILRNDIIWAKASGMPESVTDRCSRRHEHVFMYSKSGAYWFDLDTIREAHATATVARLAAGLVGIARRTPGEERDPNVYGAAAGTNTTATGSRHTAGHPNGKNPGDVWTLPTQPFSEAHFAVMPLALAERCVVAGCKPGGTVLDPFSGSGTTGLAAAKHGRKYVGIDLSADYLDLSLRTRLAQTSLLDGGAA